MCPAARAHSRPVWGERDGRSSFRWGRVRAFGCADAHFRTCSATAARVDPAASGERGSPRAPAAPCRRPPCTRGAETVSPVASGTRGRRDDGRRAGLDQLQAPVHELKSSRRMRELAPRARAAHLATLALPSVKCQPRRIACATAGRSEPILFPSLAETGAESEYSSCRYL